MTPSHARALSPVPCTKTMVVGAFAVKWPFLRWRHGGHGALRRLVQTANGEQQARLARHAARRAIRAVAAGCGCHRQGGSNVHGRGTAPWGTETTSTQRRPAHANDWARAGSGAQPPGWRRADTASWTGTGAAPLASWTWWQSWPMSLLSWR